MCGILSIGSVCLYVRQGQSQTRINNVCGWRPSCLYRNRLPHELYCLLTTILQVSGQYRARQGGVNPDTNVQLQAVMDGAKKANVPNEVIARNLKRAEDKDAASLSDIIIEAYGPGGTGFVFECLTDNKIRASTEIWTVVKKLDGKVK